MNQDKTHVDNLFTFARQTNDLGAWDRASMALQEFSDLYKADGPSNKSSLLCKFDLIQRFPKGWPAMIPSLHGQWYSWPKSDISPHYEGDL